MSSRLPVLVIDDAAERDDRHPLELESARAAFLPSHFVEPLIVASPGGTDRSVAPVAHLSLALAGHLCAREVKESGEEVGSGTLVQHPQRHASCYWTYIDGDQRRGAHHSPRLCGEPESSR